MLRTTTTCVQFAEENHHPIFNLRQVYRAYLGCRRSKRNKPSALAFEANLEDNLVLLVQELLDKSYRPGTSICFYTVKPKGREIFAADFRDRVIHHLIYNAISPAWERSFIDHSYACRPNKGTHRAAMDLQGSLRKATANGRRRAFYMKLDIRNFFMTINRNILFDLLAKKCNDADLRWLLHTVVFHEPVRDYLLQDKHHLRNTIPAHKSLFHAAKFCGLPIGNLTSQFFANVYLNELDQFVKHRLKCRFYSRYVDDMLLVGPCRLTLQELEKQISRFVASRLQLSLNDKSRRSGMVAGGVDYVGFIVRPHYVLARRRTLGNLREKMNRARRELVEERTDGILFRFDYRKLRRLLATINSYLGHLQHARCYKAVKKLWHVNTFLNVYFELDGFKVRDRFRHLRKEKMTLRRQAGLLNHVMENTICLIQVGCFFEVFGATAFRVAKIFGFQLLTNWRGWHYGCGFHRIHLARVLKISLESRIPVVVVRQTGRECAFAKERLPSVLIVPKDGSPIANGLGSVAGA